MPLLEAEVEMLDVNCRALMAMSLKFGRRFAKRGRGGMVLMSSIVGFQGTPYAAHYAATKAYVQTLAEALHVELAPLGVDVLAAAPGPMASGFAARADMKMGAALTPEEIAVPILATLGRQRYRLTWILVKVARLFAVTIAALGEGADDGASDERDDQTSSIESAIPVYTFN